MTERLVDALHESIASDEEIGYVGYAFTEESGDTFLLVDGCVNLSELARVAAGVIKEGND